MKHKTFPLVKITILPDKSIDSKNGETKESSGLDKISLPRQNLAQSCLAGVLKVEEVLDLVVQGAVLVKVEPGRRVLVVLQLDLGHGSGGQQAYN